MNKTFKKILTYTLATILALGVGFSYAYAVGANDSNAFITQTEWEAKVTQVEATLDNITKTISDTNMDYVMNGPRLRVSLIDGFENISGYGIGDYGPFNVYRSSTANTPMNKYWRSGNIINLYDMWDGRQALRIPPYGGTSDYSYEPCACRVRFAVRSDEDPNIYLCVNLYYGYRERIYAGEFIYVDISKDYHRADEYASARTVSVTLSTDEWSTPVLGPSYIDNKRVNLGDYSRTSSYVYTGTPASNKFAQYLRMNNNNTDTGYNLNNPGTGFVERKVDNTARTVKFIFDFPATACTIRQINTSSPYCVWNVIPINMAGRKFATANEFLAINNDFYSIAKVYSPTKGCLALKSYLNGEIPILNE